jgi:hypothetical protein
MAATLNSVLDRVPAGTVKPSIPGGNERTPFTLEQELTPFGKWVSDPIWVPPKDASKELAKSMLNRFGAFASKERCWSAVTAEHRSKFTQVREFELDQASIRLPKGRLFVSVTEREDFDKITDDIPNCVRTRLEEFLEGPGSKPGVKVYYLKPLCVEVEDKLIFTTQEEVTTAIAKIQDEVFAEYRRRYWYHRPAMHAAHAVDALLSKPRKIAKYYLERDKRKVDSYQAKLELNRRKAVLRASRVRKQYRSDECSFESILAITKPVERKCALAQYAQELDLTKTQINRLVRNTAKTLPWFVTLAIGAGYVGKGIVLLCSMPPLFVCDPVFVAEMPGAKGVLLKIGHFDVVDGVTHVEI